jgi:hypothetical protein
MGGNQGEILWYMGNIMGWDQMGYPLVNIPKTIECPHFE